ncbi:hypothetical protein MMC21_007260 [Puttea exsequens]|nr:hypothetical protein [Puttea exsequens]
MDRFEARLSSFVDWRHAGRLLPIQMAASGFYHSGDVHTDAVTCFNCQITMDHWSESRDPMTEHQRASPKSSWANGTYMTTLEERLGSFHTWPIDIKPLPILMASAGFYHSNKAGDGATCFSCRITLKDWKRTDSPIQQHEEHMSIDRPCAWFSKVSGQPERYVPPTPPVEPPAITTGSISRECPVCLDVLPSGNQLTKHSRQRHGYVGRGLRGQVIKRPKRLAGPSARGKPAPRGRPRGGPLLLGRYRIEKSSSTRIKPERRGSIEDRKSFY